MVAEVVVVGGIVPRLPEIMVFNHSPMVTASELSVEVARIDLVVCFCGARGLVAIVAVAVGSVFVVVLIVLEASNGISVAVNVIGVVTVWLTDTVRGGVGGLWVAGELCLWAGRLSDDWDGVL